MFFTVLSCRHSLNPMVLFIIYIYRELLNLHLQLSSLTSTSDQYIQLPTRYLQLNTPHTPPDQNIQSWAHHLTLQNWSSCDSIFIHPVTQVLLTLPLFTTNHQVCSILPPQVFLESIHFHPSPLSLSKTVPPWFLSPGLLQVS